MDFKFQPRTDEERAEFEKLYTEHTARYHPYHLEKNPFPLGGNYPESYLPYTYINDFNNNRISDFLVSTFMNQEFNGLLVLGEYGSGKSHVLHYVRKLIATNPLFDSRALCFLIQNPSVAPEDILLSLLREVKLSVIQDVIFAPIADALKTKYQDDIRSFLSHYTNFNSQRNLFSGDHSTLWKSVDISNLGYREFILLLKETGLELNHNLLHDFARDALTSRVRFDAAAIADDLIQLIAGDEAKSQQSWETFLSSRLMSSRKSSIGIEYYLQAFLALFGSTGVRHVYLLVDELEDLQTQRLTTKAASEYLATLRRMINHNYARFSFVLACTGDAWKRLTALYPAIEDRFPLRISLQRAPEETKNVVKRYLQTARHGKTRNDWAPFTEEAVGAVIEMRGVILRHVLTALRDVLDTAVAAGHQPPIDEDFVRTYLTQAS
jgi:type II secretory pathway predicted ATPase ExeA